MKLAALVRCWLYLLFYGMWRGECEFTAYSLSGRTLLIAAGIGSSTKRMAKITRVFYNPLAKDIATLHTELNDCI